MQTQELADLAGVTPRALRHYHQIGLLEEPARSSSGYRMYRVDDLVQVLRIRQLANVGVPLKEVRQILEDHPGLSTRLIDDIDRKLAEELTRIEKQRRLLASLRDQLIPSVTDGEIARFDRDIWILLTGTDHAPEGMARQIADALRSSGVMEEAARWMADLESLGDKDEVDDVTVERIVGDMLNFVEAVLPYLDIEPVEQEPPVVEHVERLWRERLSPAQQKVWRTFMPRAEKLFSGDGDETMTLGPPTQE